MRALLLAPLAAVLFATQASAIGLLVPTDPGVAPLGLVNHRVDVAVTERGATTHVDMTFQNPTGRQLEATFLFPLPKGATVDELALWMNGARTVGKVMERGQARQIYESIVRRARDPGLIEYVDSELVEIRVFPIPPNGKQRIELKYSHLIDYTGGLYRYSYPMKTDQQATSTLDDFTFTVNIKSKAPIKNLYSPTHKMASTRRGTTGIASMEKSGFSLADDLVLYWTVDDADVGLSVLSYREGDDPGYFMLLASPRDDFRDKEIIGKRVAFVVDTSGSMEGEKIAALRTALDLCLQKLGEDDLFSITTFGGYAEAWKPKMVSASSSNIAEARAYVKKIEALGGTNIGEALDLGFSTASGSEKAPLMMVFMTDGRPTVGDTDVAALVKKAETARAGKAARLFVLGVGDDLNTILLDKMSAQNGGSALYVKGNAGLTDEVTAFYDRISHPVLADLQLQIDGVTTFGTHPRNLGDLFKGQQLVVLGRYRAPGKAKVTLTGTAPKGKRAFVSEVDFASSTTEHAFIPRLWAQRQVGMLLEEIRNKGEQPGLVAEVTQLATRFGIVTPYTSYLVVEEGTVTTPVPTPVTDGRPRPPPPRPTRLTRGGIDDDKAESGSGGGWGIGSPEPSAPASMSAPEDEAPRGPRKDVVMEKAKKARESLKSDGGASGVAAAKEIGSLKGSSTSSSRAVTTVVRAMGRTFTFVAGFFVDEKSAAKDQTLSIKPYSDAFFLALKLRPDLKEALALSERVKVSVGAGKTLVVDDSAPASVDEAKLKAFLGK
ncbi:MAG: VIT and VWA domain-containing protein [Deltaproteobacteria bacterium]|nr:VIT and VWA domain-containing protein [Deltaproteobacteria bacterium]